MRQEISDILNISREFAGFLIVMELERVLRREPFVSFCRGFSIGEFGSSIAERRGAGET
jgi:orotate phosphoribosyltransferase-like protein